MRDGLRAIGAILAPVLAVLLVLALALGGVLLLVPDAVTVPTPAPRAVEPAGDWLPFEGLFVIGGIEYEVTGQARTWSTSTPTPEPFPPPPTDTPEPASVDVGTHGWGFILDTVTAYQQDDALIAVNVPSQMRQAGYDWPDLVDAAGYAGPSHARFDSLEQYAVANAGLGANVVVYVPEGTGTSDTPIDETVNLTLYLDSLVGMGATYGYDVVYGPSLELLSTDWQYGKSYDLRNAMVTHLAQRLPDGSFWILRLFTPELIYRNDLPGFRAAVQEIVTAIHAGNPSIRVILHISCPAGTEERFWSFVDAAAGLVDSAYAGIDPVRDQAGTIETMHAILGGER